MKTLNISERDGEDILRKLAESDESLAGPFERVAATHRVRTAIVSDKRQLTYADLNTIANRLAHTIVAQGGAPGDRVAILMEHDAPAIAAMIAALKADRIVVALNPTHPPARLRELMEDSEPSVLVNDANTRNLATEIAGLKCPVVGFEEHSAHGPDSNLPIARRASHPAFLAYTSGSTGRPKAVMMTHRQLHRNALIHTEAMDYTSSDRMPLFGALSGGQAVTMTWCALLAGAALYPFPVVVKGIIGLADWITRHGITVYVSSASIFRNFMRTLEPDFRFSGIRAVRLSSEPVTAEDFSLFKTHFAQDCLFVHTLSCSETCNIAVSRRSWHDDVISGRLPVGVQSKGGDVLLLDEEDRPVAPGKIGEIVVKSRYVALGYWRNPEMTAQRFSGDLDGSGTRLVHTGDLGRINAEGMLEFCGRRDDQVKVRGNRIELSEIAEALHRLPGIGRAVIEAVPLTRGEPVLVGFITLSGDQPWTQLELRRTLRAVLPNSMVPSEFVFLQSFPFTPTGKIDREKLRREFQPQRQAQFEQPQTETEKLLADIWAEIFEISDISRHDDFFALGGDSLIAAVIAAAVHNAVKVQLNLASFADFPMLAELALVVDRLRPEDADDAPPLVPVPRDKPMPLSFSQERVWQFSQTTSASAAYTTIRPYRIVGPLDVRVMNQCMDEMVGRHEILRTTFAREDGRPVAIIHSPTPTSLQYFDLSGVSDPQAQAEKIFKSEAAFVFDLSRLPLLRFTLVQLRENEYQLLRLSHHIIADDATWLIYFRELAALYEAKLRGNAMALPDFAQIQYADYAAWQRKAFDPDTPSCRKAVLWWKDNLAGAPPPPSLPFARIQPKEDASPAEGVIFWGIDHHISDRLNALASAQNATRLMVRLAAFAALLLAECGLPELVVGLYCTARNRLPLQSMMGDFSNLISLRFHSKPEKTFIQWLAVVRRQVLDAEAHSAIPYETLREQLQREGCDLPKIRIIFHTSPLHRLIEFAALKLTWMRQRLDAMPWGFTLTVDEHAEQHDCRVTFDANFYEPAGVRALLHRYEKLLDVASRYPDWAVSDLLAMIGSLSRSVPDRVICDSKNPQLSTFALLEMTDRDQDNQMQNELRELKDRMRKLEARADSLARELVLVRRQRQRLRLWLRPPLWTFEQHKPIKLRVNSGYHKEKMPTDPVSFAIVTPSLNHAKYLAATIDSVLGQNYPRLSYTVQDGGSSDNTLDILQAYGGRLTWRSERDRGQAQAINLAFATCEGDVMAYLNSDDMLLPGTLAYVARVFQQRGDVDVVYGHRIFVDRDGMEVGRAVLPRHDRKAIHWVGFIPQETMFWRRRVWDAVGKFDESFEYALDWDFILRAQQAGFKFLRVPRFLACFRVHDDQKTSLNYERGLKEMQWLRSRYIGYEPSHREVIKNFMPYLVRQFAAHWMYRFRLLRF